MPFYPVFNRLGDHLGHAELVEGAKHLQPVVGLSLYPTGHGLFHTH